ncbi:hypothetical protein NBRC116589_11670 [Ruegeria sp. HU-ET01832]|uniref:hypothetical protein n=1 Tax=Ruegeria sp. HU-ET01832 TaxID=3135906 RepID=UPI00310A0F71
MSNYSSLVAVSGVVLSFAFIIWRVRAVFQTFMRFHRAKGFGDKMDAAARHFPKDILEESMLRAGSERPAQRSLTRMTFRTAPGVIVVTILVLAVLFFIGFIRPELAPNEIFIPVKDAETAVLIKLGLVGLVIYTLIYHLANSTSIDGAELTTMSPLFQRRTYDLNKLCQIRLRHNGNYVLRFSDGKTARILKYVTGHDEMVQALEQALAANQESTCRNFPKSKRSAVG